MCVEVFIMTLISGVFSLTQLAPKQLTQRDCGLLALKQQGFSLLPQILSFVVFTGPYDLQAETQLLSEITPQAPPLIVIQHLTLQSQ